MDDNNNDKLRKTIKIKFPQKNKEQEQNNNHGLFPPSSELELASTTTTDDDDDDVIMEDSDDVDDEVEESEVREDDDGDYEAVVDKEAEAEASKKKVCPHCGKEFNGGKALGGHLRIHTDPKSRPEPVGLGPGPARLGDGLYPCSICSKKFKSSKALYGHMRAHPDRDYRGMQAPGSGSGSGSGLSWVNGKPVRALWKAKGKRNQKVYDEAEDEMEVEAEAEAEASSSYLGFTEDELEVAEVLCNFAKYASITDDNDDDLYYLHNDDLLGDNDDNNQIRRRFIDLNDDYDEKEEEYTPELLKLNVKVWECSTCNKILPSFQALGGHMSSSGHTKTAAAAAAGGDGESPPQYKCKNCDQSFPTRQGLGGHQRFHHGVPSAAAPMRSQTDGQIDNTRPDFDLNQMPEDED